MTDIIPLSTWYPAMHKMWQARLTELDRQGTQTTIPRAARTHWAHHHSVGGGDDLGLRYARQVADQHWASWRRPGGYNFFATADTRILEMCGWDHVGAHSGTHEWNRKSWGLCLQGNFQNRTPPDSMLAAAAELIAIAPRDQTTHRAIRPTPTTCPGDAYVAQLPLEVDVITRDSKADNGTPSLRASFDEVVSWGVMSEHTQPGGVAFNDELATFLKRYDNRVKKLVASAAATGGGIGAGAAIIIEGIIRGG